MFYTELVAITLFGALLFYCLSGGADFGAGVWDMFAVGERKTEQRNLIATAISPIWEANHVWLIIAIVILFTAYPSAYACLCNTLNIPFSIVLIGIVLRGAAFSFRSTYHRKDQAEQIFSGIFAIGSIITPLIFGMVAAAIAAGTLSTNMAQTWNDLLVPWTTPFCIAAGLFTLSLFAFLAATYLTVESESQTKLQNYFRKCALWSQFCSVILGLSSILFSTTYATRVFDAFRINSLCHIMLVGTSLAASIVVVSLWKKKFHIARLSAAGEVAFIVSALAACEYPFLIPSKFTIYNCAANQATLLLLLIALIAGGVILFPSLYILFRLFKGTIAKSTQ